MDDKSNNRRPIYERIYNANILSDASLFNIKPSDIVIKSFEEDLEKEEAEQDGKTDSKRE